jgi:DNA repair exonuclease SbcCD ATPase subunit
MRADAAIADAAISLVLARAGFGVRRIEIEAFKCIDAATVELGPGLNVLFGPNDLGKSSVGEAMRAALLLPSSSSAARAFDSWGAAKPPRVRLVFTHRGGLFRIDKTWAEGTRGGSLLERSVDGLVWSKQENGRAVDGELRKMLGWGVPEPGGKGGTKGLPRSFITTALLGASSRIEELFEETLADDKDPAGRERLNEALQSLAEDPLFKKILVTAQRHVEAAKDSRGNFRKGRESPLGRLGERIRELTAQHEQLVRQAEQGESVHDTLNLHRARRMELLEQLDEAKAERDRLQASYDAGAQWRDAQAKIDAAKARLDEVDRDLARVARLRAEAEAARAEVATITEQSESAAARLAQAERIEREASATLATTERDSGAEARVEELRRRELVLQRDRQRIGEQRGRIAEAVASDAAAAADAQRATAATAAARRAEQQLAAATRDVEAIEAELANANRVLALATWRDAAVAADKAERAVTDAAALSARARLMREAAQRRRAELDRTALPDAATLALLRELDARRRRAEDQAAVGFAVTLRLADGTATIAIDGADTAKVDGESTHAARRDMVITGPWGALSIEAGSAALRQELGEARARWDADGAPILAAHGVADVDALATAIARRQDEATRCEHDEQQAAALDREAAALAVDEKSLAATRDALVRATAALGDVDPKTAEIDARASTQIAAECDAITKRHATAREAIAKAQLERGLAASELDRLRTVAEASAAKADASRRELSAVAVDLVTALAERDDELVEIDRSLAEVATAITGTAAQGHLATAQARTQLELATAEVAAAKAAQLELDARLTQTRERAAGMIARADEASAAIAGSDRDALAAELDALVTGSKQLAAATRIDPDTITAATATCERVEQQLALVVAEISKAEGSLEQIGGPMMRQRAEEAQQQLAEAKQAEADLQRDIEGWQLLRDTLRSVETEQGAHLGNALGGVVESRLARLTENRYGRLDLDRDLRAQGLRIAGSARALELLSAGLKEQVATLVRLAIAEHLDSALLLDDHLAQTDPGRVEFFRELLREVGGKIQLVVLTCRPLDYLGEAELPRDSGMLDVSEAVRAIDLTRVIRRVSASDR